MTDKPLDKQADQERRSRRPARTMHDDVETWTDTCTCEAEPRWREVAEQIEREEAREEQDDSASS